MKVVILAGGFGTRITEESYLRPKPMIEIGGQPILWHIMKYYSSYGFHDFVICLGYKQYVVKEYFADYFLHTSDVTFDLSNNSMEVLQRHAEPWKVTLIDTGLHTMTGGRVKRIRDYVGNEPFLLTYGDGVSDVDLNALLAFHREKKRLATITMVNIGQAKGVLDVGDNGEIRSFREKDDSDGAVINGGFMVCEPGVFDIINQREDPDGDDFSGVTLEALARSGKLSAYRYDGFWSCMDTQRDMQQLIALWNAGNAPWKVW